MTRLPILMLATLLAPALTACVGHESPAAPPVPVAAGQAAATQFMLKFRDGRDEQAVRAALPDLGQAAGLMLTYVRPMSGQAHVLRFPFDATNAQIEQALHRLRAHPAIDYAEPDRRVKIQ
ncbi:MAG: hypothetical protein FNT29_02165 [Halothiobacillaceae bacterium]|nr:MAG: hypothetical protein FNT29_02165 [Halothiobacillaceae bacterium]